MKPEETGSHYDRLARSWQEQHLHSTYGLAALERAIRFVEHRSSALDVGCGSSCRHLEYDQFPENHVCIIAQKTG
jgi:hypothetical protein